MLRYVFILENFRALKHKKMCYLFTQKMLLSYAFLRMYSIKLNILWHNMIVNVCF